MDKFFELLVIEAIRRDIYNEVNKNINNAFEVLVKVENGSVKITEYLICKN